MLGLDPASGQERFIGYEPKTKTVHWPSVRFPIPSKKGEDWCQTLADIADLEERREESMNGGFHGAALHQIVEMLKGAGLSGVSPAEGGRSDGRTDSQGTYGDVARVLKHALG